MKGNQKAPKWAFPFSPLKVIKKNEKMENFYLKNINNQSFIKNSIAVLMLNQPIQTIRLSRLQK
jgi:hypothetical protein